MMQKECKWSRADICRTGYRILGILAFIQIGMGVLWACFHFGRVPDYPETAELLEISKTLVTDEYVGILYPALIRLTRLPAAVIGLPYQYWLYLGQLGIGFFALKKVLELFLGENRKLAAVGALWIMTMPVVLPLYLSVLPQAFAVSLLLLCLCCMVKEKPVWSALLWLLSGLLIPEYWLFGAPLWLVYMGRLVYRRVKKLDGCLWRPLLCLLAACLAAAAVQAVVAEPYSRGRMERSALSMALHRVVWPHYATNSYFWHGDVHALFDEDALYELAADPAYSATKFGYAMEKTYELEWCREIYRHMVGNSWEVRTKEIVLDMGNDLAGNSLPVYFFLRNLEGQGVSYAAWNYGQMSEAAPRLTHFYVQLSGTLNCALILLAFLLALGKYFVRRRRSAGGGRYAAAALLAAAVVQSVWYTIAAPGACDFKNVMGVSICLGLWTVCRLVKRDLKENAIHEKC